MLISDLELRLNPLARPSGEVDLPGRRPGDDDAPDVRALAGEILARVRAPRSGPTLVMGILNVTPDSFSDGGRFADAEAAVCRGLALRREGADWVDVGGESTRPGAEPVAAEEELRRVVPVVEALAREGVPVSIDTQKAAVARAALAAGARLVNDVSALGDPEMAPAVAAAGAGIVLMHMQGIPATMQQDPRYENVVAEVALFLRRAAKKALSAGIAPDKILVDPGIGFGKLLEDNLELLRRLGELRSLGFPIVVGTSRKRFIGEVLGRPVDGRLFGTAASVAAAVLRGASCVRVHDAREMADVVRMADRLR